MLQRTKVGERKGLNAAVRDTIQQRPSGSEGSLPLFVDRGSVSAQLAVDDCRGKTRKFKKNDEAPSDDIYTHPLIACLE